MCEKEEEIIEGEVRKRNITVKEKGLLEWAEQSYKNNLEIYNDVLKLLLNLILPFFSGLIVFFQYVDVYSEKRWYMPFIFLFFSFITSLFGILPCTREINLIKVNAIEDFRESTLKRKKWSMIISIFLLFSSFLTIFYLIA